MPSTFVGYLLSITLGKTAVIEFGVHSPEQRNDGSPYCLFLLLSFTEHRKGCVYWLEQRDGSSSLIGALCSHVTTQGTEVAAKAACINQLEKHSHDDTALPLLSSPLCVANSLVNIRKGRVVAMKGACPSCGEDVFAFVKPEGHSLPRLKSKCHVCAQPLVFQLKVEVGGVVGSGWVDDYRRDTQWLGDIPLGAMLAGGRVK